MRVSPEMDNFRQQLQNLYDEIKLTIPRDSTDEFLSTNSDYKKCVIIYNVLATIFGSEDGYEWGEMAAELDGYDIETFLKHWNVEIVKKATGYDLKFQFNDIALTQSFPIQHDETQRSITEKS